MDDGGRRSPRRLVGLPEPQVGDPFTASRGRPLGRVVAVEPGRSLTGTILGAWMTYLLVPQGDASTRLLLTVVMATGPLRARAIWQTPLRFATTCAARRTASGSEPGSPADPR